jgi:hypothetical protein
MLCIPFRVAVKTSWKLLTANKKRPASHYEYGAVLQEF